MIMSRVFKNVHLVFGALDVLVSRKLAMWGLRSANAYINHLQSIRCCCPYFRKCTPGLTVLVILGRFHIYETNIPPNRLAGPLSAIGKAPDP